MSQVEYVHLVPTGVSSSSSAKSVAELVAQGWYCDICHRPKPGAGPVDFQIYQTRPANEPLDVVGHSGIDLARRDFLSLLGEKNVSKCLMLGAVMDSTGKSIDGWATVRGRHRIIVRGSLKQGFERYVGTRSCEACGNLIYFAYPPKYLYPAPDPAVAIFQSQLGGLVVRPDLIAHLDLKRTKGFGIEKLKVLDAPRDGLGLLEAT